MSTSDSTRDPLGLGDRRDRPPTRYDEEGKSLPERGSGYLPPTPATSVDSLQEPETLVIPAEAVAYLLNAAVQNQVGNAWWNGFVTAHGLPSWVVNGQWAFEARDVRVVKAQRQNGVIGK